MIPTKKHARRARLGTRPSKTQIDRQGMATFARNGSVFFSSLRTGYRDTEWGMYAQEILEGTKWKDLLDKIFKPSSP